MQNKKWTRYTYNIFEGFRTEFFDVNSLYGNDNNIIKDFQCNLKNAPIFNTYIACIENNTICVDTWNAVNKHIDTYTDRKKKETDLIDSYYTKKSYKLVEEN